MRRRIPLPLPVLAVVTLAVVAILPLASPSTAAATSVDGVVGLYVGSTTNVSYWSPVLPSLKPAGFGSIRVFLPWDRIETRQGVRNWRSVDEVLRLASARGLKVQFVVKDTPGWAQAGTDDHRRGPDDPSTLRRFCTALASRFRGRIGALQVWNEPNATRYFAAYPGKTLPQSYVRVLKAVYRGAKAGDPGVKIVAGNTDGRYATTATAWAQDDFLRACYAAGAHGFFNVWATHNYPGNPSGRVPEFTFGNWADGRSVWGVVDRLRALLDAHGDGGKPLAISEVGWPHSGERASYAAAASYDTQSRYTVRHIVHAYEHHVVSYHVMFVRDVSGAPMGLFSSTYQPYRVFGAIKTLLTTLKGTTYDGRLDAGTNNYAYRFRRAGGRIVVVAWTVAGETIDESGTPATAATTVTLPLPAGTSYAIRSLRGASLGTLHDGSQLQLHNDPVLLVQQ